jgi:hypothetical protein
MVQPELWTSFPLHKKQVTLLMVSFDNKRTTENYSLLCDRLSIGAVTNSRRTGRLEFLVLTWYQYDLTVCVRRSRMLVLDDLSRL